MKYLFKTILIFVFFANGCGTQVDSDLKSTDDVELKPIQWPNDMAREIAEDKRFNTEKVIAAAFSKKVDGSYQYSSLNQLLEDPLFAQYRSKQGYSSKGYLRKVEMGVSQGLFQSSATRTRPRILHTTGLTTFTLYTDESHKASYESMEIMAIDKATAATEFVFLDFSSGKPRLDRSGNNCQGCHDGRAIWQMYNFWPGMNEGARYSKEAQRTLGSTTDIGFTIAHYQTNLARVARSLLENKRYYEVEGQAIAALLDCDDSYFDFAETEEYADTEISMKKKYYADLEYLVEQVNDANETLGQRHRNAGYETDGKYRTGTYTNHNDPIRLAKLKVLLEGKNVDLDTWSISRGAGEESILFQSSGAISLSQLAYYLITGSPNAEKLLNIVPDPEKLTYKTYPETTAAICEGLTE